MTAKEPDVEAIVRHWRLGLTIGEIKNLYDVSARDLFYIISIGDFLDQPIEIIETNLLSLQEWMTCCDIVDLFLEWKK